MRTLNTDKKSGGKLIKDEKFEVIREAGRVLLDLNQRYDVLEAAAFLRLAPSTVWKLIKDEKLEVIREAGRVFVAGAVIAGHSRPKSMAAAAQPTTDAA
jgi:hypothetical protein